MVRIGLMGTMKVGKEKILRMFVDFVETYDCGVYIDKAIIKGKNKFDIKNGDIIRKTSVANRLIFTHNETRSHHEIFAPRGDIGLAVNRMELHTISRITREVIGVFAVDYSLNDQLKFCDIFHYFPRKIKIYLSRFDLLAGTDEEKKQILENMKKNIISYFKKRRITVDGFHLIYFNTDDPECIEKNNNAMRMIIELATGLKLGNDLLKLKKLKPKKSKKNKKNSQDSPRNLQKNLKSIMKINTDNSETEICKVIKKINQGGMAEIFLVEYNNQDAILKRSSIRNTKKSKKYWEREVHLLRRQSTSQFRSLQFYDSFQNSKYEYCILMEYVPGPNLEEWMEIQKKKWYSGIPNEEQIIELVKNILLPLCGHLSYIHQLGIIHRDLTPRNIMIETKDNTIIPVIIDWGVARELSPQKMYNPAKPFFISHKSNVATMIQSVGNPPEILGGYEPVAASDIYMYGAVMYYLFSGGIYCTLTELVKSDYLLNIFKYNPKVPTKLADLLQSMMRYEPADRIANFSLVFEEIQDYLHTNVHDNQSSLPSTYIGNNHMLRYDLMEKEQEKNVETSLVKTYYDKTKREEEKRINETVAVKNHLKKKHQEPQEIIPTSLQISNSQDKVNYHGTLLIQQDYDALMFLEKKVGTIPAISDNGNNKFGFVANENHVIQLNLSNRNLTTLPENFGNFSFLKKLNLSNNELISLPNSFGRLNSLTQVDLDLNKLTSLPKSFENLISLTELNLGRNRLTSLPENIGKLTRLTKLILKRNRISSLPESIGNLTSLTHLDMQSCSLTSFPESIENLTSLDYLNMVLYPKPVIPIRIIQWTEILIEYGCYVRL